MPHDHRRLPNLPCRAVGQQVRRHPATRGGGGVVSLRYAALRSGAGRPTGSVLVRTLRLTADDRQAWREYEQANRRAAEQYKALPTAHCHAGEGSPCVRCHQRRTRAKGGVCPTCRRADEEVRAS